MKYIYFLTCSCKIIFILKVRKTQVVGGLREKINTNIYTSSSHNPGLCPISSHLRDFSPLISLD